MTAPSNVSIEHKTIFTASLTDVNLTVALPAPKVSPLSCEPPAGVDGRLEEDQDPRASLVNCSGWLGRRLFEAGQGLRECLNDLINLKHHKRLHLSNGQVSEVGVIRATVDAGG